MEPQVTSSPSTNKLLAKSRKQFPKDTEIKLRPVMGPRSGLFEYVPMTSERLI